MGSDFFSPVQVFLLFPHLPSCVPFFQGVGCCTLPQILPLAGRGPLGAWLIPATEPPPERGGGPGLNKSVPERRSPDPTALPAGRSRMGRDPGGDYALDRSAHASLVVHTAGDGGTLLGCLLKSGPALENKHQELFVGLCSERSGWVGGGSDSFHQPFQDVPSSEKWTLLHN